MGDERLRIRAGRSLGELEIEGPAALVAEYWEKLWPVLLEGGIRSTSVQAGHAGSAPTIDHNRMPAIFGEYYDEFRSGISDVDKVLVAGLFAQSQDMDKTFTTKIANQLLLDQGIKVSNASQCVTNLKQSKRVFSVTPGKFRVSARGLEHLQSLKSD